MKIFRRSFLVFIGICFLTFPPALTRAGSKSPGFSGHSLLRLPGATSPNFDAVSCKSQNPGFRLLFFKFFQLDTVIDPRGSLTEIPGPIDVKVILSNGDNRLEFSPLSSMNNTGLIQPINRVSNKGISTNFYLFDSSNWKFFTNGQERLNINGAGNIITSSPLLINMAEPDSNTVFRVNGTARFDSVIKLQGPVDTSSFISIHRNIKRAFYDGYDPYNPYTTTPTGWANGGNIPAFRLRHPNKNDFMILPYQYGTAIEYNGIVECWVGEWSIHRGLSFSDPEGMGNGWGGVLWVGDDNDLGGVRATSRNNNLTGGNVNYGELSVETFIGLPHGDMRLRLPSNESSFQFIYGGRGSNNIVAKLSDKGFFLPKVASTAEISTPEKAQLVFDSTDNNLKAYDGTKWITIGDNGSKASITLSANGTDSTFTIAHGLGSVPAYFNVLATSKDAAAISYVTAGADNLLIHYNTVPPQGTNNLSFNWEVKP